jgi:hypothetical protein
MIRTRAFVSISHISLVYTGINPELLTQTNTEYQYQRQGGRLYEYEYGTIRQGWHISQGSGFSVDLEPAALGLERRALLTEVIRDKLGSRNVMFLDFDSVLLIAFQVSSH